MARPRRGMGRGLEAILSVSDGGGARQLDELREVPLELIAPSSNQPRRRFDARALEALAGSLGERGVLQPVLVRPKADGRLRAGGGRAPLARRQDRGAAGDPCTRARPRRRRSARAGADREHGARGSQPGRGGAGLRRTGRGARAHTRGGRAPRRAQPRCGQQSDAPAGPARRDAGAARGGPA